MFVLLLLLADVTNSTEHLVAELKAGHYEQVIDQAKGLLRSNPSDAAVWILQGLAFSKLNRHPESLSDFNRALKLKPRSLPALEGATQEAYTLHDPTAPALVKRLLSADPANPSAHAIAAVLDVESKNCASAIDHFEKGLPAIQSDPLALTQYGACLIAQEKSSAAIPLLEQAVSQQAGSVAANYDLAVALLETGQSTRAAVILDRLPPTSDVLNLRAECLLAQDKLQDAIASLRKAIEAAPSDERNYIDLASLCVDHASYDLGIEIATIGLKNLPKSAKLLTLRAAIHTLQGNDDAASSDFEQAARLRPDQDFGSVGLSLMLQGSARSEEAEAILRKALKAHPRDPGLLFLLGDLLVRRDSESTDRQQALKLFSQAATIKPSFAKPHAALGKMYLQSGDPERAKEELQKAVELDPNDHMALHQLVLAFRQLGLTAQADQTGRTLRRLLDEDRKQEVAKNKIRLSAAETTN